MFRPHQDFLRFSQVSVSIRPLLNLERALIGTHDHQGSENGKQDSPKRLEVRRGQAIGQRQEEGIHHREKNKRSRRRSVESVESGERNRETWLQIRRSKEKGIGNYRWPPTDAQQGFEPSGQNSHCCEHSFNPSRLESRRRLRPAETEKLETQKVYGGVRSSLFPTKRTRY